MADYTPIAGSTLVAGQPIRQETMVALRDNPIAIVERSTNAPRGGWPVPHFYPYTSSIRRYSVTLPTNTTQLIVEAVSAATDGSTDSDGDDVSGLSGQAIKAWLTFSQVNADTEITVDIVAGWNSGHQASNNRVSTITVKQDDTTFVTLSTGRPTDTSTNSIVSVSGESIISASISRSQIIIPLRFGQQGFGSRRGTHGAVLLWY